MTRGKWQAHHWAAVNALVMGVTFGGMFALYRDWLLGAWAAGVLLLVAAWNWFDVRGKINEWRFRRLMGKK